MREKIVLFVVNSLIIYTNSLHLSFLNEDEINHNRFEREDNVPCDEDTLMNFLAEIQVINPESVVKLATLNDLGPSCTKVAQNLEKINNYLKTCTPPSQPDLYFQLIKGVESLHEKLCVDSPFRKKFEQIHQCLHELRNDLEDCGGPADWNENSDNAAVCKAYKDVADCYYIKTASVCGKNAAATTKELLEAIIDSILTIHCPNIKSNPSVNDPMPEEYIKKEHNEAVKFKPLLVLQTLVIVFIPLFMH